MRPKLTKKARITASDNAIQERLNEKDHVIVEGGKVEPKDWSEHPFNRYPNFQEELSHVLSNDEFAEAENDFLPDVYDETYLRMDLALPNRVEPDPQFARVTKCLHSVNGLPIGKASENPILDTRMYQIECTDGDKSLLSANLISENMFEQIDEEGNRHVLMDKITDHRFDEATVKRQDAFVTTSSGTKRRS